MWILVELEDRGRELSKDFVDFKKVTPNAWGSGTAWEFNFILNNFTKTWIQGGNISTPL